MIAERINSHSWLKDVLSLLTGAALPLAFAPFNAWWLAFVLPGFVFLLWSGDGPRRGFRRGYLFGLGMFGVGVSWVFVAIHVYGFTSLPVAVLLTGLFVAFLALFPAIQAWIACRLEERWNPGPAQKWILLWPAVWILMEWFRGWFLTGFPWLNLGYSQIDTFMSGYAPMLGVYGLGAVTVVASGMLLLFIEVPALRRRTALGLLGIGLLGFIAGMISWTQPVGKPLKVALLQGNVPQMTKWDPAALQQRLDTYAGMTRDNWDADIVIWPENSVTVFYHHLARDFFAPLMQEAGKHHTELLVGLPFQEPDGEHYYSSFAAFTDRVSFYHKRHLVPFGEYVPLQNLLRGLIGFFDLPMSGFSRGSADQSPLQIQGHTIATSICYEDAFGEEVIRFLPEAQFLVNGSNNAWYGDSLAPHQHLQISRMRALETGRPLLRVTTNGVSALVDEQGRVLKRSPQFEQYVLRGEIQPFQGSTPYVLLGNFPAIILAIAVLLWLGWVSRGARQTPDRRIPS